MELSKPIPSRLTIAAHSCNCFYVGQVQTCFTCHQTGRMTKDCPNHARTIGNIINADGPLTRVNRPSTSIVPDERIGAHGTGNQVKHTTDESHTRFPQLTGGPNPSITASNADSHSLGLHASSTNNDLGNQQLNNSVTHSDVPNAAVRRDKNVRDINEGGVTSTLPPSSAAVSFPVVQPSYRKDSDNSEDEDEFVDVLEELPLPEGEGGQQPDSIVLGKRTREPDESDITEKRVDRNPSSDGSVVEDDFVPSSLPLPPSPLARFSFPNPFSSLSDEVDPISMDHDANGVANPFERTTFVQRKVRTRKSQMPSKVDDSSPLPSSPPADDSVSIASEVPGTPSIEAYEGGDEEDGGNDNMEQSMAKDNEYPNIPENGSEFSTYGSGK